MDLVHYPYGTKATVSKDEFEGIARMVTGDYWSARTFTDAQGEPYRVIRCEIATEAKGKRKIRFTLWTPNGYEEGEIVEE